MSEDHRKQFLAAVSHRAQHARMSIEKLPPGTDPTLVADAAAHSLKSTLDSISRVESAIGTRVGALLAAQLAAPFSRLLSATDDPLEIEEVLGEALTMVHNELLEAVNAAYPEPFRGYTDLKADDVIETIEVLEHIETLEAILLFEEDQRRPRITVTRAANARLAELREASDEADTDHTDDDEEEGE